MTDKRRDGNQQHVNDADASDSQNILQESIDYYLDNGLMVFTAGFLSRLGNCCERGCRHCPYGYPNRNQEK